MTQQEIIGTIAAAQVEIRDKFRADVKGIFGSRARGEAKEESDLDVLVVFLPGADLLDLVGLADYLEELFKLKVDVVSERSIPKKLRDSIYLDLLPV